MELYDVNGTWYLSSALKYSLEFLAFKSYYYFSAGTFSVHMANITLNSWIRTIKTSQINVEYNCKTQALMFDPSNKRTIFQGGSHHLFFICAGDINVNSTFLLSLYVFHFHLLAAKSPKHIDEVILTPLTN